MKEYQCDMCEDTRKREDGTPCNWCCPPKHLDGLPMGELSNECVQEYFDNPENDSMFGHGEE